MKTYKRAFTLIEVLLAITIFSVIAVSLYATFRSGVEINRRANDINQLSSEARWFFERITSDLKNARNYDFANSYPGRRAFLGEKSRVSFIVPKETGLTFVSYYLEAPASGSIYETMIGRRTKKNVTVISKKEEALPLQLLIREEDTFFASLSSTQSLTKEEEKETEVLSTGVEEGTLKFFYAYLEGEKMIWKDSWDKFYLPRMIRVQLKFVHPSGAEQPLDIYQDIILPTGHFGT